MKIESKKPRPRKTPPGIFCATPFPIALGLLLGLAGSHCLQIDPSPLDSSRDPVALLATYLLNPVPESPVYGVRVGGFQKISETEGNFAGALADGDEFGVSTALIGDLDGDGTADLAAGAFKDDDGGTQRGAAYVLFMNAAGAVHSRQKISDTQGNFTATLGNVDQFGTALCSPGDLNGDAVSDLVVTAQLDDDGGANRGAVYVLFMNTNGTVNTFQKISDTAGNFTATLDNDDNFGIACVSPGDLNGDGVADLAVGAQNDDDGGTDRGAVYVLFMQTNGTVNSFQKISDTTGNFTAGLDDADEFGFSLAAPGDLNGDGVPDLVAGARNDDDGGTDRGAVYVLYMETNGSVGSFRKISASQGNFTAALDDGDQFGNSAASAGDLNGDGIVDLFVGAPGDDDGGTNRGAVHVLFMNSDGTVNYSQKISGTQGNFAGPLDDDDEFGRSVTGSADINGDGTPDLFAGARNDDDGGTNRGAAYLLFLERIEL